MEELLQWFVREGGTYDAGAFHITEIPGRGRGIVALKDLPADHCLITIPRDLTLSLRTSELPSLFGPETWREFKLNKGWTGLILCMMWEEAKCLRQNGHSKWDVYLNSMPSSFDTPMFWTEEDLKELKGTSVIDKLGKEDAERDYHDKLLPVVKSRPDIFNLDDPSEAKCYSLENYHITGSRILSRSFNVEPWRDEFDEASFEDGDGEEHGGGGENGQEPTDEMDVDRSAELQKGGNEKHEGESDDTESDDEDSEWLTADTAMVPLADMLNAGFQSESAVLLHEPSNMKMVTTRKIRAGEEILNTYTNPPNSVLLRRYGFVNRVPLKSYFSNWEWKGPEEHLLGNPHDVVELPGALVLEVVLEKQSKLRNVETVTKDDLTERIDWWLEEGGDDVFVLDYLSWEHPPGDLISFTRLLLAPASEWEKTRKKGKPPKAKIDMLTTQVLKEVLTKKEQKYPSTYEDDLRLHCNDLENDPQLSLNKRNAIIVRVGERHILRKFYHSLEEKEKKLSSTVEGSVSTDDKKRKHSSMEASKLKRKRT